MSTGVFKRPEKVGLPVIGERGGVRPAYGGLPEEIRGKGADALYVHVPFCTTKCHYCDFYSIAGHLDQADAFLDAMGAEIALWGGKMERISPETIFVGGGTPTLLDAGRLEKLLGMIRGAIDDSRLVEFTVEGNPNTFDADRAAALVRHGGNRGSFGGQSFVAEELRTLQRDHDPENVAKAFAIARAAGLDNLNVDLIFGIPGQTLESWEYSLSQALALGGGGEAGPEHMSCY